MGATLEERTKDGKLEAVVVEVVPNSPAQQADLRVGDVVNAVNGSSLEGKPGFIEEVLRLIGSKQTVMLGAKRYAAA